MSLLAFLVASASFCADPTPLPNWPVLPAAPDVPRPMPGPVTLLTAEELFVVQSDGEVQLLSSPPGRVNVTEEAGPIRIRGRFVDGKGAVETRTYSKKHVFIVERIEAGPVELLLVPRGAVERRMIDGTEPAPPPKPEPVTSFRVIFVYESGDLLTAQQNSVIYGKTVENYLNAKCTGGKAGWRRRDKDAPGENDLTMAALWAAVKPKITTTPCVVVAINDKADIIPLSSTPADQVAKFKEYLGDK